MNLEKMMEELRKIVGDDTDITVIVNEYTSEENEKDKCDCDSHCEGNCNCEKDKCDCDEEKQTVTLEHAARSAADLIHFFHGKTEGEVALYNMGTELSARKQGYDYTIDVRKL